MSAPQSFPPLVDKVGRLEREVAYLRSSLWRLRRERLAWKARAIALGWERVEGQHTRGKRQ